MNITIDLDDLKQSLSEAYIEGWGGAKELKDQFVDQKVIELMKHATAINPEESTRIPEKARAGRWVRSEGTRPIPNEIPLAPSEGVQVGLLNTIALSKKVGKKSLAEKLINLSPFATDILGYVGKDVDYSDYDSSWEENTDR
jgi:hypothetical protein